jgi:hypothetical protein
MWTSPHQTISFEVVQGFACVPVPVLQIPLRNDAKRADCGEYPAFRAVDFVDALAVPHWPAFTAARQVEVLDEHVARIPIAGMITVAGSATASAVSVAEVVAVATVGRARIVSVPHNRRFVAEHHEFVVTLGTWL